MSKRDPHVPPAVSPGAIKPRRAASLRLWALAVIPLVLVVMNIALPLANQAFPASEMASCTVLQKGEHARRSIAPNAHTDCGSFIASKEIVCTTDPRQTLHLVEGVTYDLVLRGPRIPLIASPVVSNATLSTQQKHEIDTDVYEAKASDIPEVRQMMEEFSPEKLRAFDYEQPAFDPLCDISRHVMTTKGLQQMPPPRAKQVLTPPEGVVPREPLLPCDGFWCSDPLADLPASG